MALLIFLFLDGNEVAAFEALAVPRVGETVWCKTFDFEGSVTVEAVEHQFDRSGPESYSNQDVCIYGRALKPQSSGA